LQQIIKFEASKSLSKYSSTFTRTGIPNSHHLEHFLDEKIIERISNLMNGIKSSNKYDP
jgi:Mn-dependent DtxR family transcriptional regulator